MHCSDDPGNEGLMMMLCKQIDSSRYYRNGPVGSTSRVESASAVPMESYSIEGTTLRGPVTASAWR